MDRVKTQINSLYFCLSFSYTLVVINYRLIIIMISNIDPTTNYKNDGNVFIMTMIILKNTTTTSK